MAQGFQHGTSCLPTLQQYAINACVSATGKVSAGYQSCTGYSFHEATNKVSLNMVVTGFDVQNNSINSGYQIPLTPQPCEYPTFTDTYVPILASIIPVLALIWVGKRLYSVFNDRSNNV